LRNKVTLKMNTKIIIGIILVLLLVEIVAGVTYQIYVGNKLVTLSTIKDICGRDFTSSQGSIEATQQLNEASDLYKKGLC